LGLYKRVREHVKYRIQLAYVVLIQEKNYMVQQLRGENTIKSEGKVENVIIHNMQTMIQIEAATLLGDYTEAMNMLKAMYKLKYTVYYTAKPKNFTFLCNTVCGFRR